MQMYAKNGKPYTLNHRDKEHKTQPAALLSFLVIGSGWLTSVTAICTAFGPGIWTQGNAHWNKAETAGSTTLVANTIFGAWNLQSPEVRASS